MANVTFLALRNILKRVFPVFGRFVETYTTSSTPKPSNTNVYADSRSPFIFSAIRKRDISKFWVSAKGVDNKEDGLFHDPQVIYDEKPDDEILNFVRWNFDTRLSSAMPQVLRQINRNKIVFGVAIQEIVYAQEQTPFGDRIVIDRLVDVDPRMFAIDPPDLPPGLYLKSRPSQRMFSKADRQPDIKFAIFSNNQIFDDRNGISEVAVLSHIQDDYMGIWRDLRRGIEIAGRGLLLGKYGRELLGAQNAAKRAEFVEEIQKISSSTCTVTYEGNQIESVNIPLNHEAFETGLRHILQATSLVLTGKVDSLQETRYGSYGREEAGGVREKSDLEKLDCAVVQNGFNNQIIKYLVDFNFNDTEEYPRLQLIEPQLYQATTPKEQDIQIDGNGQNQQVPPPNTTPTPKTMMSDSSCLSLHGSLRNPAPELLDTTNILDSGSRYLRRIDVKKASDFDALPDAKKRHTFTVHALKEKGNEELFRELLAGINGTLSLLDHQDAFAAYKIHAKNVLRKYQTSLQDHELMPSFMFARQLAFNQGILEEAKTKDITAFQFQTTGDKQVRPEHKRLNNVIKSVDDTFWKTYLPPIDYNCRCSIKPIVGFHIPTPADQIPSTPIYKGAE